MGEQKDTMQLRNPIGIYIIVVCLVLQCIGSLNLLLKLSFSPSNLNISSGQYISTFVFGFFIPIWAIIGLLEAKFFGWWFTVFLFTHSLFDTILWLFWDNNIRAIIFTLWVSVTPILKGTLIFLPVLYRIAVAVLILRYLLRLEMKGRFSVKSSTGFLTIIAFSGVLVVVGRLLAPGLYAKGLG